MISPTLDKIFLIDDNSVDLFIQRKFIQSSSLAKTIIEYQSPVEALKYLSSQEVDLPGLIFLDLNMPEMDGFSFLERFQTLPQLPTPVPVVILTSSGSDRDKERAMTYRNVVSFITKPLTIKGIEELRINVLNVS